MTPSIGPGSNPLAYRASCTRRTRLASESGLGLVALLVELCVLVAPWEVGGLLGALEGEAEGCVGVVVAAGALYVG